MIQILVMNCHGMKMVQVFGTLLVNSNGIGKIVFVEHQILGIVGAFVCGLLLIWLKRYAVSLLDNGPNYLAGCFIQKGYESISLKKFELM